MPDVVVTETLSVSESAQEYSAWLAGWLYRKSVTLSRASGAVTNYQMKVLVGESSGSGTNDVHCAGHVLASFNDLRFTAADGTMLDYWIESISGTTPNQVATVWVEFNSIGTGATTFYMYYGKSDAPAVSNGANTFIFFDDFERGSDGDDIGGVWATTGAPRELPHISTTHAYGTGTRSAKLWGNANYCNMIASDVVTAASGVYAIRCRIWKEDLHSTPYVLYHSNGSYETTVAMRVAGGEDIYYRTGGWNDTGYDLTPDAWQLMEITDLDWTAHTYDIWNEGNKVKDAAGMYNVAEIAANSLYFSSNDATEGAGHNFYLDDIIVRNWRATEPAWGTWGEEDTYGIDVVASETVSFSEVTDRSIDWLEGWSYRKTVTLSRASGSVTNYQMKLLVGESSGSGTNDVHCEGHVLSSFNDLRFTNSDGKTLLDYWIEEITGTTPNQVATVWIEFDSIGTSDTKFFMFYGCAGASAYSDGDDTFLLFDNFPGSSLDASKWTDDPVTAWTVTGGSAVMDIGPFTQAPWWRYITSVNEYTGPLAIEARSKIGNDTYPYSWWWALFWDSALQTTGYYGGYYYPPSGDRYSAVGKSGTGATSDTTIETLTKDAWYRSSLRVGTTDQKFFLNGVEKGSISVSIETNPAHVILATARASSPSHFTAYYDWVAVRKYVDTEPAWGVWGAEAGYGAIDTSASEGLSFSESVTATVTSFAVTLSVSENLGISESPNATVQSFIVNLSVTESLTITVTVQSLEVDFTVTESLTIGEVPNPAVCGPVDDEYTKVLVHFNGEDGSRVLVDESGKIWSPSGDAQLDTALKKFGSAAGLFDGTGDYFSTPDHVDFTLGSGDFTFDAWIRVVNPGSIFRSIIGQCDGDQNNISFVFCIAADKKIQGTIFSGATEYSCKSTALVDDGNWHHVAFVRNGNTIKIALDGVFGTGVDVTGVSANDNDDTVSIGRFGASGDMYWWGSIDELRYSKGIARWTSNFSSSLPTEEYGANPVTVTVAEALTSAEATSNAVGDILSSLQETLSLTEILAEQLGDLLTGVFDSLGISDEAQKSIEDIGLSASETVSFSEASGEVIGGISTLLTELISSLEALSNLIGDVEQEISEPLTLSEEITLSVITAPVEISESQSLTVDEMVIAVTQSSVRKSSSFLVL